MVLNSIVYLAVDTDFNVTAVCVDYKEVPEFNGLGRRAWLVSFGLGERVKKELSHGIISHERFALMANSSRGI